MMKVSLVLEAVNRISGPVRQIMSSVNKLGVSVAAAGSRVAYMGDQARDAMYHFRKLAGPEGLASASKSVAYFRRQVSGLTSGLSLLKYASGAAVIGLGEEFVRGVFKAGGETQQMLVTLTRLEGSATRAKAAMSWMQNFSIASGSAFTMPDIMRSYQMAKNFGMSPQGGSLAAFADLAAGERVPLKQVLIAVKDAMEGTSTRPIANLGIKMKQGKGGGPNSYLYSDLTGRFVTEHSAKTPEATLRKLVEIINKKYAGLAALQAKTLPGGIAQLKNMLYQFEAKVAGSGVLDWAVAQMNRFIKWLQGLSKSGALDAFAKSISNFITGTGKKLIDFLVNTNWKAVGADLKLLGASLQVVAGTINMLAAAGGGGLSGLFNAMIVGKILAIASALAGLAPVISATAMVLFGLDIAVAPITMVIFAVGALIAIGYLLWANWDKITGWFKGIWDGMPGWLKGAITGVLFCLNPFLGAVAIIMQAWSPLTSFFENLWGSIKKVFATTIPTIADMVPPWARVGAGALIGAPLGPAGIAMGSALLTSRGAQPAPARQAPHAAHLTVEIKGDGAQGARVTKLKSNSPDFSLHVKRGPVTTGF